MDPIALISLALALLVTSRALFSLALAARPEACAASTEAFADMVDGSRAATVATVARLVHTVFLWYHSFSFLWSRAGAGAGAGTSVGVGADERGVAAGGRGAWYRWRSTCRFSTSRVKDRERDRDGE